jgi:hypothetical protein
MPEGMTASDDDEAADSGRRGSADAPSGKPYRWQIPEPERPPLLAFPPEAIAGPLDHAIAFRRAATERTAAFLIVVSRNNGYEGCDPRIVYDDLACGTVAGMLGFDVGVLASVLVDLEHRDLVEATEAGCLRLKDIAALDRLSDGG